MSHPITITDMQNGNLLRNFSHKALISNLKYIVMNIDYYQLCSHPLSVIFYQILLVLNQ